MGLDVTAYSNIKPLRPYRDGDIDYDAGERHVFTFSAFPHAAAGLVDATVQSPTHDDLVADYVYDVNGGEAHSWSCRAYSHYNRFRASLATFVGYEPEDAWDDPEGFSDRPFFELVDFSDCDGCIGPVASRALLEDFTAHRDAYRALYYDAGDGYSFASLYEEFIEGLRLAADNGILRFH